MSPRNELDEYIETNLGHLFPKGNDARTLYHYTTVDTFEVMTRRDADFICTYCAAMNDSAEFSIGIKLIRDYMRRHPGTMDAEMGTALVNCPRIRRLHRGQCRSLVMGIPLTSGFLILTEKMAAWQLGLISMI